MNPSKNPPILILYGTFLFVLLFWTIPVLGNFHIDAKITSVYVGMIGGVLGTIIWAIVQIYYSNQKKNL